ncbi:MAG: AAA family ATPase, partial [Prevotellaceae bacterium]|nr:AAA family ATPase [Prevotellaceae bacterium]
MKTVLLRIGDISDDGKVTIIDEDRLCYIVKNESKGASGLRTISKSLLSEFIDYVKTNPQTKADEARKALCGKTDNDKFEYGYASTLVAMAEMAIYKEKFTSQESRNSVPLKSSSFRPYLAAIKSKPFLLLAGISGTGKSRIVRELARACWDADSEEYKAQKPKNFEMVQVKPNWHDSGELIGYVSRVSGKAEFVAGDFLKFVAKAWEDLDTPYFLCLDEMNLAPVEQYFAEYLSVVESRKRNDDGMVVTDPILKKANEEWYFNLTALLTSDEKIRKQFNDEGISLPQNLIVVGTVNMDETTFSFSRKVLDRAMTIEMNEVDLYAGLTD